MLDRLQYVKQRFDEISDLIIQPDVIADQKRYVQLNKEYKDLKALVDKRDEYIVLDGNIKEANEIIADGSDAEMVEMAKMQLEEAKERLPQLEEEIKFMLIPKDPEDAKNVMVEIRAGTGGDEASIFAGDLYRMYTKYCDSKGWRTSVVDVSEGTSGGFKEVIFEVTGEDVYGTLKYSHKLNNKVNIYVQGKAGYAFMFDGKTIDEANDSIKEVETLIGYDIDAEYGIKGKMYTGVAVGAEMGNYTLGLSYDITKADLEITGSEAAGWADFEGENVKTKVEYSKLALTVGYKFGK